MTRHFYCILTILASAIAAYSANPMSTRYSYEQCQGSLMPYPVSIEQAAYPDSLTPVLINHVGRHGARYAASDKNSQKLKSALNRAADSGTITPLGATLRQINDEVIALSNGQWGALDSLGEYEQRIIASRMYQCFKPLFDNSRIYAISSYSPRAMMSMYCFTHQLDRLNNRISFETNTSRANNILMRPFDVDLEYKEFRESGEAQAAYMTYYEEVCPVSAIERVLGQDFEYADRDEQQDLAITEYYVLAGLSAMSYECDLSQFFTIDEINALWSCFNVRQYLNYASSTLSSAPADMAGLLLSDIIRTFDECIEGKSKYQVYLRFGHAETLMPLLSLMRLKGCYYMTNYLDTLARNWCDFDIVPMAANIQLILLRHNKTGQYYLRIDLNGRTIPLLPNGDSYTPWTKAQEYLTRCLPLHLQ